MSNDFYMDSGVPATSAAGSSSTMRAEFALIEAGFDKLPALTGNGSKALVINAGGTSVTVTTGTLTLAGNFATSGASALTLTTTGATNVTLPTTGTLATLAGTEVLSGKTISLAFNTEFALKKSSATAGHWGLVIRNSANTDLFRLTVGGATDAVMQMVALDTSVTAAVFGGAIENSVQNIRFTTDASIEQVRITHTASANRYISLTGANSGNPTIDVSGGSLAITPSVVMAGAILTITDGDIVLANAKALQLKDAGGTIFNAAVMSAADVLSFGMGTRSGRTELVGGSASDGIRLNPHGSQSAKYVELGVPAAATLTMTPVGSNLSFGTAAVATSATTGHIAIPSCAGTPTGAAQANCPSGLLPMVYDSTNHKLYVNTTGTTWKGVTLS